MELEARPNADESRMVHVSGLLELLSDEREEPTCC